MKIKCTKCDGIYSIPDEKLEGKKGKVKVRCPKCSAVLVVQVRKKAAARKEEAQEWHYAEGAEQRGPVPLSVLKELLAGGSLSPDTLVWRPGFESWTRARLIPELEVPAAVPPAEAAPAEAPQPEEPVREEPAAEARAPEAPAPEAVQERAEEPAAAPRAEAGAEEPAAFGPAASEPARAPESDTMRFTGADVPSPDAGAAEQGSAGGEAPGADAPAAEQEDTLRMAERPLFADEGAEVKVTARLDVSEVLDRQAGQPVDGGISGVEAGQSEDGGVSRVGFQEDAPTQVAAPDTTRMFMEMEREAKPRQEDSMDRARSLLSRALAVIHEEGAEAGSGAAAEQPPAREPAPLFGAEAGAFAAAGGEREDEGEAELFAAYDAKAEPPAETVRGSVSSGSKDMLYTRRETSVLFSLDDLKHKDATVSQGKPDDSGLIDIRQVAFGQEQQSDDLFGSATGELPAAGPSAKTDTRLASPFSVPMFRRRRRWPAALGLSAGGVVAVAAAVYLVFSFVAGPGPELIKQTLASASEKAFLDRTKHRDELREEWEARVGKARGTQEALKRKAEAEAAEELASFAEQQRRRKVDAASEQARQLAGLEAKAAGLRQAAEEKKAAAAESAKAGAAAAAGAGTGAAGTDAGKGAVAVKDAGKKDLGKKDAGKKDLGKKDAGKGEAKKAEAPKVEEKKEEVAKAEEKKVEAPPEEAKKDDAKEILKGLDEKKDESAGAGGDTGKKTLTMGDITKVVNQNKPEMKACFEKYGAGLESATIRTKVTIAASGEVTAVTISSMEFAGTALGNCVRKVQLGMKFPATATQQTKSISVRLP